MSLIKDIKKENDKLRLEVKWMKGQKEMLLHRNKGLKEKSWMLKKMGKELMSLFGYFIERNGKELVIPREVFDDIMENPKDDIEIGLEDDGYHIRIAGEEKS